jgi:DNA-binding NarL/FixJ family response regulator
MPDIMLVDDNQSFLEVAQEFIETFDDMQIVTIAYCGADALEALEQRQPDILVVDVSMPGMTGLEVTRQVTERWPELRVVILTMLDTTAHRNVAIAAGADAFVAKASMDKDLIPVLRELAFGNVPRRHASA